MTEMPVGRGRAVSAAAGPIAASVAGLNRPELRTDIGSRPVVPLAVIETGVAVSELRARARRVEPVDRLTRAVGVHVGIGVVAGIDCRRAGDHGHQTPIGLERVRTVAGHQLLHPVVVRLDIGRHRITAGRRDEHQPERPACRDTRRLERPVGRHFERASLVVGDDERDGAARQCAEHCAAAA